MSKGPGPRDHGEGQKVFSFDSTCFNTVERGLENAFTIAVQKNRTDVEANKVKLFVRVLRTYQFRSRPL